MNEAFKLMLTGMSTVFLILIMVVVLGNIIIRITNKFAVVTAAPTGGRTLMPGDIEPKKLAAIVSAVEISTKGKGKITSIEKVK